VKFLSVCSGIEAASVAWNPLGWKAVAFSEIERFPSAVLAHHYPDVPNLGDMTKFHEWPDLEFDLLVGGTPCQSFSVAGLRKGLADPRGNLALTYLALADRYRPRWLVWENVPGVLSSSKGRDFGAFLGGLGELGYGWSYRVLDAQYCGVPQRRRRVFVVGHSSGDFRRAAEVLFERHSLSGDSAPCRKTGEGITHDAAPCLGASGRGFERAGETRGQDPVIAVSHDPACLPAIAFQSRIARNGRGQPEEICPTLQGADAGETSDMRPLIAFTSEKYYTHEYRQDSINSTDGPADAPCPSRTRVAQGYHVQSGVRRLLPVECERLQGFTEATNAVIISACLDLQENCARAEIQSLRLPEFAPIAEDGGSHEAAQYVAGFSRNGQVKKELAAVLHVQRRQGTRLLGFLNAGKCQLSAMNAEKADWFRRLIQEESFADALALIQLGLRSVVQNGKEESLEPIRCFSTPLPGRNAAREFGQGTLRNADGAESCARQAVKFITSNRIPNFQPFDLQSQIWFCSALLVIALCIPEETRTGSSYDAAIILTSDYTDVPYNGGWSADGPRYKALGNSMATPVVRWIGERIQLSDKP
jgi:DNA-cytosine methyltransferase